MPSAVVDVCRSYTAVEEVGLLDAVHQSIVEAFKVAPTHRNVVLVVHDSHRFRGRTDSPAPDRTTNVTLYVLPGRSLQAKRKLYQLIVERLGQFGIPKACVLIRLIELPATDFGVRGGLPLADVELGYALDV